MGAPQQTKLPQHTPRNSDTQYPAGRPTVHTPFTPEEHKRVSTNLGKLLGPEFISFRALGGGRVSYIEGWRALNLANEMFGFDGWSSEIISKEIDFMDASNGRYLMGMSLLVRVTLKNGLFHEDFGYGVIENAKLKAMAFEKCRKEALTDGIKRCLRCFGNVLGNCLYDKSLVNKSQKAELDDETFYRDPHHVRQLRAKAVSTTSVVYEKKEESPKLPQQSVEKQNGQSLPPPTNAKVVAANASSITPKGEAPSDDDLFCFSDDDAGIAHEEAKAGDSEVPPSLPVMFVPATALERFAHPTVPPTNADDLPRYDAKFVSQRLAKSSVDQSKLAHVTRALTTSVKTSIPPLATSPKRSTRAIASQRLHESSQTHGRGVGAPPAKRAKK